MTTAEFINGLKVGDYIHTRGRYNGGVEKITKITPKQIVTMWASRMEERYDKSTGMRRGTAASIYSHWITMDPVTDEEKERYEAQAAEEIRMEKERQRTDVITKAAAQYLTDLLGVPADNVNVYVQSNDGLKTVTWRIKIDDIPEANILSFLEVR